MADATQDLGGINDVHMTVFLRLKLEVSVRNDAVIGVKVELHV